MKFSQRLCEAKFRSAPIALKTLLPGQPRFSELGYGRPGTAGNPTVTTPLQALKCLALLRESGLTTPLHALKRLVLLRETDWAAG